MYKNVVLLFFSLLIAAFAFGETDTISIQNLKSGISLDEYWKFKRGDDKRWAMPNFDDSSWKVAEHDTVRRDSTEIDKTGITWYRTSFVIDSLIDNTPLAIEIRVLGAVDIFYDGKLIQSLGTVGTSAEEEKSGFSVQTTVVPLPFNNKGTHHIAIRQSTHGFAGKLGIVSISGFDFVKFEFTLLSMQKALENMRDISSEIILVFFSGVFLVLSLFHFILYLYYRKNRSNLYYSLFTFFMFSIFAAAYATVSGTDFDTTLIMLRLILISVFTAPLFFLGILYEVFYSRLTKLFWILAVFVVAALASIFYLEKQALGTIILTIFSFVVVIETFRVIIRAVVKKREGAWVFVFGLLFPIVGTIALNIVCIFLERVKLEVISNWISEHLAEFMGYSFLMSVSIAMTIYLGRDFARMNKKLHLQLKEIKLLFDRSIEQENEKKKILENQKEKLERMVEQRTEEVVSQKAVIESKNKDILDNLLYAKRIQEAILPDLRLISQSLKDSFILYWPKDIVSGDFYSFFHLNEKVIIAAADCTGHGVTGAFMSMIGSSILNQIINEKKITEPGKILSHLNVGVCGALKQTDMEVNDGMDICLCSIDLSEKKLQYAGANRPLWIVRNGEFKMIRPDKTAIGGFHEHENTNFSNHLIDLQSGDSIYLFTDGYADQFGGAEGKKMLSKRFREILLGMQNLSMSEQKKQLTDFFNNWKKDEVQVDDVLVIGIKI